MMLVTANTYEESECISDTGMIENDLVGTLKEVQTIISVGPNVRELKPGDLVYLDFSKYMKHKYTKDETKADMPDEYYNSVVSYEIPMFEINNQICLLVDSANVFFKIDKFEIETTEVSMPTSKKNILVS